MTEFIETKSKRISLIVLSIFIMFGARYIAFVTNQVYILQNYAYVFESYNGEYVEYNGYIITSNGEELENGLVLFEDYLIHYSNNEPTEVKYSDYNILTLNDIYDNYLVYNYSQYLNPIVILGFVLYGIVTYSSFVAIGYIAIMGIEYIARRKNQRFEYKVKKYRIALMPAFIAGIVYSYMTSYFGMTYSYFPIIIIIVMLVALFERKLVDVMDELY